MSDLVVFEKEIQGGSKYEILESKGFSGHTELAIRVGGKIASILVIEKKRTGNIVCQPIQSKRILIEVKEEKQVSQSGPPTLTDVLSEEDIEEENIPQSES